MTVAVVVILGSWSNREKTQEFVTGFLLGLRTHNFGAHRRIGPVAPGHEITLRGQILYTATPENNLLGVVGVSKRGV